eukprot:12404579-Karenia_brevis.AAC.1
MPMGVAGVSGICHWLIVEDPQGHNTAISTHFTSESLGCSVGTQAKFTDSSRSGCDHTTLR